MAKSTIDLMNTLLRAEISAAETHRIAIERLHKATFLPVLRETLAAHEQRVGTLRAEITRQGGKPAETSGVWGTFAKLIEGGAAMLGDKAAIAALEDGEDRGRDGYQSSLDKLDQPTREFVAPLLTGQLASHTAISTLKKNLAGPAAPPHAGA